jgi:excisionase family DNA binding protein
MTVDVAAVLYAIESDPEARERLAVALGVGAPRALYTTASLAAEIGVSERTIRRAITEGELHATRRCGRWIITVDDVLAWVRTGRPARRNRPSAPRQLKRPGGLAAALADVEDDAQHVA